MGSGLARHGLDPVRAADPGLGQLHAKRLYQCMQVACNQEPVEVTCSKTAAGWFYYGPCPSGAVPVQ